MQLFVEFNANTSVKFKSKVKAAKKSRWVISGPESCAALGASTGQISPDNNLTCMLSVWCGSVGGKEHNRHMLCCVGGKLYLET